ncbi:MAG: hypothetical protein ACQCN4_13155 [Candidatus Bathyarchaeia archaeon]
MRCKICQRQAQDKGYCPLHLQAYHNIREKYLVWMKASDVSWREYLGYVQKNSLTGEWAKEVAKQLITEENQDV